MATTEDPTGLREAVDRLTEELKESKQDRRKLHFTNRLLTSVVVVLAVGTGGSIFASVSANNASNEAKAASDKVASVAHANYATCLAGNQFRDDDRNLWTAVIVTLQPLTGSPQGKQFVAEIQHDVEVATTPRVCRAA